MTSPRGSQHSKSAEPLALIINRTSSAGPMRRSRAKTEGEGDTAAVEWAPLSPEEANVARALREYFGEERFALIPADLLVCFIRGVCWPFCATWRALPHIRPLCGVHRLCAREKRLAHHQQGPARGDARLEAGRGC